MTAVREISCPSCGGNVALKAAGFSVTVACPYCGSFLDVAHPDVRLIQEYHQAIADLPLKLGSRGELFGTEWEAVGALERTDGDVTWLEFLLFNPYAGYRWLILADGEWQFGTMLVDVPEIQGGGDEATWRDDDYERDYEPAETETRRVVGEFYWRVRAGDTVMACTYSRGRTTLSREVSADETSWSVLIPIAESTIAAAFPGYDVARGAAFAARPQATGALSTANLVAYFVTAALAAGLLFVLLSAVHDYSPEVAARADVAVDGPPMNATLGTLRMERSSGAVTITARSPPFTNRWVDLDYSLIDEATGQAITGYTVLEHYSGRDWSEGSHSASARFASVPQGTYEVTVEASAHAWLGSGYGAPVRYPGQGPESMHLVFAIERDAWFWENDLVALVLLFAWPAAALYFSRKAGRE